MTTIGITIFPPKSGFSFFSNGAHQNVAYLWMLFRAAGYRVLMINGGDGEPPKSADMPPALRELEFYRLPDVINQIDVLIEAGAQVESEAVARVHARGGKAITLKFGNAYVIDGERAIHNLQAGAIFNGAQFDEVWTTSQHAPTCGSYWETLYRCPVRVLPHVWEPIFVDHMTAHFPPTLKAGYQPGRQKKRIAILEPNIQFVKTCHIPMLIAERAYRERPDLIDRVMVTNSIHMRKRLAFETFVGALDMCRDKGVDGFPICTFEPRYNTPWFLAAHGDVVVSHGWIDTPTYLHYDVLHLGYPLVHNITDMPGFWYPGFDAIIGGRALITALTWSEHREAMSDYADKARAFLSKRRTTSPPNLAIHAHMLEVLIRGHR